MRSSLRIVTTMALAGAVLGVAAPAAAAASPQAVEDRLPDLRMGDLQGIRITVTSGGTRLLRFGTIAPNLGAGPLEVRMKRASTADPMVIKQRIFRTDGSTRYVLTPATTFYAGDGHDHWHIRSFLSLELFAHDAPQTVYKIKKLGFCLIDAKAYRLSHPGAPQSPVYRSCGGRDALRVVSGISLGWADDYPWHYRYQWIRLPSDLPVGNYRLCAVADPRNDFIESHEANNHVWHDLHIDVAKSEVRQVGKGRTACRPSAP